MPSSPELLREVSLFALLDDDELAVLAAQVEQKTFAPRQRIYKTGDAGGQGYVVLSGAVDVTTIDEDNQDVVVDQPGPGEVFGFASMLGQTQHQTDAVASTETVCIEIDRNDIFVLIERKPHAGMDLMAVLRQADSRRSGTGAQPRHAQRQRNHRGAGNPRRTNRRLRRPLRRLLGVHHHLPGGAGGLFRDQHRARQKRLDPYPFILLNLFLSMLAALQAPVIMMSQNRQDKKDRVRSELDFDVNRRAESEIQGLSRKMNLMSEKLGDLEDLLREHTTR